MGNPVTDSTKFPQLKFGECCCCITLGTGILIIGIIQIVVAILYLIGGITGSGIAYVGVIKTILCFVSGVLLCLASRQINMNSNLEFCFSKLINVKPFERMRCIETLIKIHRNILSDPSLDKYRKLNLSNKRFAEEVWKYEGGRALMLTNGWIMEGDCVRLPQEVDISPLMAALIENREIKQPKSEAEFVKHNEAEAMLQKSNREEYLNNKAKEERRKELAAFKRDKEERQALARSIAAEHSNDRKTKAVENPSVATPLRGSGGGKGSLSTLKKDDKG